MAVNWNLAGPGFDASQVLQSFGQAQDQRLQTQRQQAALAEQQRQRQMEIQQQQRAQQAGQMAAQGNVQGGRQLALNSGDWSLVNHLSGLQDDQRKQTLDSFKELGQYALLADTPEKWDQYVSYYAQQGHPEAESYRGKFGLRAQILAQAGMASDYQKQQQVDYKVVPPGGYLQGFGANGQPIGDVQTAPPQQQAQPQGAGVPSAAIQHLQQNPSLAAAFDAKYGAGASRQYMGGAPSQGGATFP